MSLSKNLCEHACAYSSHFDIGDRRCVYSRIAACSYKLLVIFCGQKESRPKTFVRKCFPCMVRIGCRNLRADAQKLRTNTDQQVDFSRLRLMQRYSVTYAIRCSHCLAYATIQKLLTKFHKACDCWVSWQLIEEHKMQRIALPLQHISQYMMTLNMQCAHHWHDSPKTFIQLVLDYWQNDGTSA